MGNTFVDSGLLLAGDVFISNMISAGNFGPAIGPINVTQLQATPPTTDEKSRTSNKKSSFGQTLDAVRIPKDPAKLSIQWDTATKQALADAVGGKYESFTQAVETITDEAVTLSTAGYVELAKQDIDSASFTVTKTSGGAAMVEGTDFEVNREMGLIKALLDASAVPVKVSYKTKAATGTTITGATEINKPRRVIVDGVNLATNERVRVIFYQVSFSASGSTDLLNGDFLEGQLEGTLITPAGKAAPWEMKIYDAAA